MRVPSKGAVFMSRNRLGAKHGPLCHIQHVMLRKTSVHVVNTLAASSRHPDASGTADAVDPKQPPSHPSSRRPGEHPDGSTRITGSRPGSAPRPVRLSGTEKRRKATCSGCMRYPAGRLTQGGSHGCILRIIVRQHNARYPSFRRNHCGLAGLRSQLRPDISHPAPSPNQPSTGCAASA
jgi:hypothetical protein